MFLRSKQRFKDGKEHRYWSIVENHRTIDKQIVQRQVLYLGEINDGQQASWVKTIEVIQGGEVPRRQMALFPADRTFPELPCEAVQIQLKALELHRPRQWGACWLAGQLWNLLDLDSFWIPRLPASRKKTRWLTILKILVFYRLISPGSEWRLHREWYQRSAESGSGLFSLHSAFNLDPVPSIKPKPRQRGCIFIEKSLFYNGKRMRKNKRCQGEKQGKRQGKESLCRKSPNSGDIEKEAKNFADEIKLDI